MTFRVVPDSLRAETEQLTEEDKKIIRKLNEGKTVFVTGMTDVHARRYYAYFRRLGLTLHRKVRNLDGVSGKALWLEEEE